MNTKKHETNSKSIQVSYNPAPHTTHSSFHIKVHFFRNNPEGQKRKLGETWQRKDTQ